MNTDWVNGTACRTSERTVLVFTNVAARVTIDSVTISGTALSINAAYIHINGILRIDITDFVRLGSGAVVFREHTTPNTTKTVSWQSLQGQDPAKAIAPPTVYADTITTLQGDGVAFGLPSVMIAPASGEADIAAQIFAPKIEDIGAKTDTEEETSLVGNILTIPHCETLYVIDTGTDQIAETIRLRAQECGKVYARCVWRSRFGEAKNHFFEVAKLTTSKYEDTDLQDDPHAGLYGYRQDSGEELSAVLRLEGLPPYDVWYYSDILTSNTLTVEIGGVRYEASVTTKSVDIPLSTVNTYDLEFSVTLTHFNS